ncbi:MAG TPA: 23S rRNA (pseudouridine(1915)-N(3))-methyltransferase RlmH [Bacteroidales bacterium]|jgi:23S rRNA (pseudouridine1915-N3)-methyltransferase|nr:23S rRNA (pseudouridine(1915)-N(3))-methyltransferase RlmH [Bacteroidales bacterium]MDY0160721.1 23S rRNA (pseudouridine(1915)-N(3))-methyltransferase RlmH [Bacteroidales bacterium]HXK81775.1 23S rRNA (pseudouridine(1915)-N(3))-methyltransferase RlmH [Bacteroidales bacterium]
MKFKLICVGKTNFQFVQNGLDEYFNRVKKYIDFELLCIPNTKISNSLSIGEQNNLEGKLILSNIEKSDMLIILDDKGKQFSSVEFATELNKLMMSGKKQIVFVIGGAYGFSNDVYSRANKLVSLSKMTFSHQIIRLLFAEQLYRACTILNNEAYHHE